MDASEGWYVVKQADGQCTIVPANQLVFDKQDQGDLMNERWGPYPTQREAIARRVGLIRSGKCKPA
ncbi:MAG: hypothetical protein HC866_23670 [Leptolyngbyaceae cyanobacterium RU_5_1]|nr:hypothetical protein [Leptolyngbyaceae cyanobacterium RU_5_1]